LNLNYLDQKFKENNYVGQKTIRDIENDLKRFSKDMNESQIKKIKTEKQVFSVINLLILND